MKTCLLCGEDAPDTAATCPNDGEASWREPTEKRAEAPKPRADRKASK